MKFTIALEDLLGHEKLTVGKNPFGPGNYVRRLAWKRGTVPPHLRPFLIKKGECKGETGKIEFKGKVIPKAAKCVAEKHAKR